MTDPLFPILILGGTTEGYALAERLQAIEGIRPISSLAGRTANPRLPVGDYRIGGFGGPQGLADYLRTEQIGAVIDATHPFARQMGWNAAQACEMADVPLLRLERPAWVAQDGDHWDMIDDWQDGVALVRQHSARVLMAVGKQELAPFATLDHVWFLIRTVDLPQPMPPFAQYENLLARGPFSLDQERDLLRDRAIDTIVCKNSGGRATDAKLTAARELGIRVVMQRRPARPATPTATSVAEASAWVSQFLG